MTPLSLARGVHAALASTAVPRTPEVAPPPTGVGPTVALPVPGPPDAGLARTVRRRRSAYAFGAQPTLAALAGVLHHGVAPGPRAGGLPSLVPYLVVRAPGGLAAGVWRADLRLPVPGLVPVRAGDPTAYVAGSLDQPPFATRVPVWLALVADLGVSLGRYPARHYRTLHVDAGVALHGAMLTATALGLATCPVMGYDDGAWSLLLDLPDDRFPVVLLALGLRR